MRNAVINRVRLCTQAKTHIIHLRQDQACEANRDSLSHVRLSSRASQLQVLYSIPEATHYQATLMNRIVDQLRLQLQHHCQPRLSDTGPQYHTWFLPAENCLRTTAYRKAMVKACGESQIATVSGIRVSIALRADLFRCI